MTSKAIQFLSSLSDDLDGPRAEGFLDFVRKEAGNPSPIVRDLLTHANEWAHTLHDRNLVEVSWGIVRSINPGAYQTLREQRE